MLTELEFAIKIIHLCYHFLLLSARISDRNKTFYHDRSTWDEEILMPLTAQEKKQNKTPKQSGVREGVCNVTKGHVERKKGERLNTQGVERGRKRKGRGVFVKESTLAPLKEQSTSQF